MSTSARGSWHGLQVTRVWDGLWQHWAAVMNLTAVASTTKNGKEKVGSLRPLAAAQRGRNQRQQQQELQAAAGGPTAAAPPPPPTHPGRRGTLVPPEW